MIKTIDDVMRRSRIDGDFDGFDSDMLFILADGTFWIQHEYKYSYHYAFNPEALIIRKNGRLHIKIDRMTETAAVREITGVIQSRINGNFNGWDGNSEYTLANGQVWKQIDTTLKMKMAMNPKMVIYKPGMRHIMMVKGTKAKVERIQ